MILTVDIGNTRVKWVLYENLLAVSDGAFAYTSDTFNEVVVNAEMPLKDVEVIISNVAGARVEKQLTGILESSGCKNYVYAQTQREQCGVTNAYVDVSRLGVDRWLGMIAGFNHQERLPEEFVCVISCGTAVTLDVVNNEGCHLGGVIAPGFQLMQSELLRKTSDINGLDEYVAVENLCLAKSTEGAVHQGCAQLLVGGLDSMIARYSDEQKNKMRIIVTGGDGVWVAKLLAAEAQFESLLVNKGLLHTSKCINN